MSQLQDTVDKISKPETISVLSKAQDVLLSSKKDFASAELGIRNLYREAKDIPNLLQKLVGTFPKLEFSTTPYPLVIYPPTTARRRSSAESDQKDLSPDNQEDEDKIYIFPSDNKKYKVLRKMLNLLVSKERVSVFLLAKCIEPKLTRKRFKNSNTLLTKVENRIRKLRTKVTPYACKIKLKEDYYEFIRNS